MKRMGGLIIILALVLLPLLGGQAAAACANASSFGAVSFDVPDLSRPVDQKLWLRVQAPLSGGRLLVEINQADCVEVNLAPSGGKWAWQSHDVSFVTATNNTLKLIGVTDGAKVDRVLLVEQDCTPQDLGDNCQQAVELNQEKTSRVPWQRVATVAGLLVVLVLLAWIVRRVRRRRERHFRGF